MFWSKDRFCAMDKTLSALEALGCVEVVRFVTRLGVLFACLNGF